MISRRAVIAAVAASPLAAIGCAKPPRLRIGYQRNGVLLAAKQRGDLEAKLKGVARVAWTEFPSGPPLLDAMSVGSIDVGGTGDTPPIFAQAAGAHIVYVAAQPVSGAAAAIIVRARSKLQSVGDLRGQRFAFTRGSSAQSLVEAALAGAGMSLDDTDAINLTPTQAAEAFASGAVDAWAIWDPYFAQAEVEHGGRVLVAGRGLAASNSFVLSNRSFAAGQPEILRTALDTLAATARWGAAHRDALADLIVAATQFDPRVAARIASRQDLAVVALAPAIIARQQALADTLRARGAIAGPVGIAAAVWPGWCAPA